MMDSCAVAYADFCQTHASEIPVFFQPWWLDAVGQLGHWQKYVIRDGSNQPVGIWPVFTKRRYGFYWHTLPPYTPVSGPWFATDGALTEPMLSAMVHQISGSGLYWLLQSIRYVGQAAWWEKNGFKVSIRYTHRLPATNDADTLFRKFRTTTRNEIRKAARNLQVRSVNDLRQFMPLYTQHAQRKHIFVPAAAQVFQSIHAACLVHGQGQLLCAYDGQEHLHAGVFVVWDQQTTHVLVISRSRDFHTSSATRLLLWHAIQQSAAGGRAFDFEGGNIPSIGDFFASFGTEKTAYLRATLYPNTLVRALVRLAKYVRHPRSRLFR